MPLAIDFHEEFVQLPLTLVAIPHRLHPPAPDLGAKHPAKSDRSYPIKLVTNLDPTLIQKVLEDSKRQREPDAVNHRQADGLGAGLEVPERGTFGHAVKLAGCPRRLNQVPPTTSVILLRLCASVGSRECHYLVVNNSEW